MRTSRISQDTTRILSALSAPGVATTGSTRSQRQTRRAASSNNGIDSPQDIENSSMPSRKRKRESQVNENASGTTNKLEVHSTSPRRSPRSAPPEDTQTTAAARKAKRQPAKRIKGLDGDISIEPPPNWERMYNVTAEMRKRVLAPVDTMGCESLAEETRSPQDRRLQTLIALMLSSQTKDTVTAVAMKNLQDNLPGGFCLESLLKVDPIMLNGLINKVGFHNNKTKFIKQTAEILRDKFSSEIPDTIDGLVSLPGVGPKMAYLTMSAAWGRDEGIGVDVHVHRITNLWGWHKTSTPEQTRAELEAWLPREKWHDINHLLVGFGQTYCPPVGRKCGDCDLSALKLCPSAVASSPVKKRVKKEVEIKLEDGAVTKIADMLVEEDDVGVKFEADTVEQGQVEIHGKS